ncbi:MAG: hypothetical protein JXL97_00615 [Bacteroidales bacterium]|nr:hypothetical protein [Bacteroidales bacterium]
MKKLFSVFTAVIIFATIFTSCEKQGFEETKSENQKVLELTDVLTDIKVEDGVLSFNSLNTYETFIQNCSSMSDSEILEIMSKYDFKSLFMKFKEKEKTNELPIYDILFTSILNYENKVKIGEYLFTLDFEKRSLIVKNIEKKDLVKNFGFDDNVLEVIFKNSELQTTNYSCESKTSYCGWNERVPFIFGEMNYKIEYFPSGIYNVLYARVSQGISSNFEIGVYFKPNVCYWVNKDDNDYTISGSKGGTGSWYSLNMYRSTKRLTGYLIDAGFKIKDANGNIHVEFLTMNCP